MQANPNWHMPSLSRDLAIIGGGILFVAAGIGAAVGIVADVLWHRHRQGAKCDG